MQENAWTAAASVIGAEYTAEVAKELTSVQPLRWPSDTAAMADHRSRTPPARIVDAEADGSIGKRMREVMEAEGRKPPEWLDAKKSEESSSV